MKLWIHGLIIAMVVGSSTLLAACNTVEGAGKDIERGGEKVQDAADPNNRR